MQRILNDPDKVVDEMVAGFLKVHSDIVQPTDNPRVVRSREDTQGRVGIVAGGGSGHKPAFIGYVGRGMVDAVAVGEIFSSPTAKTFYDAFKAADGGQGVACLYGNFSGDIMNVKMAVKMAQRDGITVKTLAANDDVPSAPAGERDKRRGGVAEIFMWMAGAARSAKGGTLDEVIAAAQKVLDNTRSAGIGLSPCTLPAVGTPNFTIEEGTMELGIGHHGEPGIEVVPLETAAQIAARLVDVLLPDLPYASGDEVTVMLSGLGATPVMELYVLYDEVERLLAAKGIKVFRAYTGNYFTSLEMMGATLSLVRMDDELKELFSGETRTMGLSQFAR